MGKGKITIVSQQVQPDQKISVDKVQKSKAQKMKNKIKKQKKKMMKKSTIQMIADQEQQQYNNQYQQQQRPQTQQKHQSIPQNKSLFFDSKYKLKHLAICFPDSILEIPQTSALRSYFISQVARISAIFKVDQIVILKDHGYNAKSQNFNPTEYIARNLQYLQTPQYLRKHLFKMHPDLKNAGLMNPIQCHHHLKANDVCQFRQGVSLDRPTKQGAGSWVDIGLKQQARMNCMLLPNTRVTLRLKDYQNETASFYEAQAVSKKIPREQKNLYWGYDVRMANNFKQMLKGKEYNIKIICNHHELIKQIENIHDFEHMDLDDKSVLIFFSGTDDLNTLISRDDKAVLKVEDVIKLFDYSLSFENFGVQKLRMEQQLFMSLCKISKVVQ